MQCLPWPGHLMGFASPPPAMMVQCRNGKLLRVSVLLQLVARPLLKVHLRHGTLLRGHLMGNVSPLGGTAMYKYGMLSPEAILTLIAAMLITTQAITHQALPSIAWPGRLMGST